MEYIKFYEQHHRTLDKLTPLRFDCGRLCGKACCRVVPELPGMYLFPGEEALFEGIPGFTIASVELPGFGPVGLLSCDGDCTRSARPLACRVFPLAPKEENGRSSVRIDPRGRSVCPLCMDAVQALSADFVKAVEDVFATLLADLHTAGFVFALSRHLDEFEKPL